MKNGTATRITTSLTAAWEKRNLPRIARALPAWVMPDHLTLLAIFAALVIGASYVLSNFSPTWMLLSIVGLALHWFGDSLDGTLARVRNRRRERYGYYVDHIADAGCTVVIGVGFGLSPFVDLQVALLLTIGYLLLQVRTEIGAYTSAKFDLSFGRLGPTEVRIMLAAVNLVLAFWTPPRLWIGSLSYTWVDFICLTMSLIFMAIFGASSIIEARKLGEVDP